MNEVDNNATTPRQRLKPAPALGLRLLGDKKCAGYIPTHTHTHTRRHRIHACILLKPNNHAGFSLFGDKQLWVCTPHASFSFKRINIYIFFVYVIGESHASRGFQPDTGTVYAVSLLNLEAAPCL